MPVFPLGKSGISQTQARAREDGLPALRFTCRNDRCLFLSSGQFRSVEVTGYLEMRPLEKNFSFMTAFLLLRHVGNQSG